MALLVKPAASVASPKVSGPVPVELLKAAPVISMAFCDPVFPVSMIRALFAAVPASRALPGGAVVAGGVTVVSIPMPCWKKFIKSCTVLVPVTAKVDGDSDRPPFEPASVSVCPTENSGVVADVAEARSVNTVDAVGAAVGALMLTMS